MRRPLTQLVALLVLAVCAAGCRPGGDGETEAPPAGAAGRPVRGGTLVVGSSADIAGVNEAVVQSTNITDEVLYNLLFKTLAQEQGDFAAGPPSFEPQLAERWEFSPDRKTLTFHLRENAVWSDGVPVTADDVRWTWQVHTHPDVGYVEAAAKERITDVEVVDRKTVRFHFREVYGKQFLEANEGVILPRHAWGKLPLPRWRASADWFRENLVTSGPYVLASWTPQQELVFARNPRFYDPALPYLDRVVIRVVPDQAAMMAQLQNGGLDFVTGLSSQDVPAVRADPSLQLIAYPYRLFVVIAWNLKDPRFASPAVRRALAMAIDREGLVDALWGEFARVGSSPIVEGVWARNPAVRPLPYDPAAARRILAENGWRDNDGDGVLDKDGRPFRFELSTNTGNRQREDATVMIQEQLRRIGVAVEPRVLEFHSLMDQLDDGSYHATVAGFGMDTSLDLTSIFHSRSIADANNYARYRNPEVDRLIERVLRYPEIGQARDDLHRIQQIVHDEQPLTYLWESQRINAANRRLRNVQSNIMYSLFDVEEWWMAPE